jgi:ring-1,2-phenylacetyl-CoA epoxidase subunit PaaD
VVILSRRSRPHASVSRGEADPATRARAVAESVVDPELPMLTLEDLGVLRDVRLQNSTIVVEIAPTYSGCPAVAEMRADLITGLAAAGFPDVDVRLVLDPPWSTDDISPRGCALLAQHGIAPPGPAPVRRPGPVPIMLGERPSSPACPQCGSSVTDVTSAFGPTPCTALCRCRACGEPFQSVKAL